MKFGKLFRILGGVREKNASSLLSFGLALVFSSILMVIFLSLMMLKNLIDDHLVSARIISANSTAILMFSDRETGNEMLSAFAASNSIQVASLYLNDGRLLSQYKEESATASPILPEGMRTDGYEIGLRHLHVFQPVMQNGEIVGYVALRFGLGQYYQRLIGYVSMMLSVALLAFLFMKFSLFRMKKIVNRAESDLDYLAHTDPVTQLPNRHAFNKKLAEYLAQADKSGGEVGLILLDLDNFKVVNDTMGHQCGDLLLRMLALRLIGATRNTDVVCRIGGDEFVVIIGRVNKTLKDVQSIANRILEVLAEPFKFDSNEFFLTASVGSSLYPRDAADSETLIRKADTAMYSAKMKGKNTFETFMPEMDQIAQRRLALEHNLRRALERNEIMLHYQPQIDLRSRRIIGVEALMRWQHPELGMVSPAEFIPVAEETGLIVPLGKWALRTACLQVASWREAGHEQIRIAVNLSARQAREPGLIDDIQEILSETRLPPFLLELEITEGIMMENVHANIQLLHSLQKAGISLAIDDFGTGYSSMSYLKRFPIDQLKIDRSFVHDIQSGGGAIISAILAMAHSLGISVVAEGVETDAQLTFLEKMNCDIAQGFYFARPMPAEELIVFLDKQLDETPRNLSVT